MISVNGTKQWPDILRFRYGCKMCFLDLSQRIDHISRRIIACPLCIDGVAEYLTSHPTHTSCRGICHMLSGPTDKQKNRQMAGFLFSSCFHRRGSKRRSEMMKWWSYAHPQKIFNPFMINKLYRTLEAAYPRTYPQPIVLITSMSPCSQGDGSMCSPGTVN